MRFKSYFCPYCKKWRTNAKISIREHKKKCRLSLIKELCEGGQK